MRCSLAAVTSDKSTMNSVFFFLTEMYGHKLAMKANENLGQSLGPCGIFWTATDFFVC